MASTKWFIDMTPQERVQFTELLKTYDNDPVLKQLRKVLNQRLQDLQRTQMSDYDKASWPHYQAHRNGQQEMVQEIINMITN